MRPSLVWLVVGYAALLAYASLYPLTGWQGTVRPLELFAAPWPLRYSRADVLTNVLSYIPFGLLLGLWWRAGHSRLSVVYATLAATGLSTTLELAQQAMPGRVASGIDVLCNSSGALAGALLARFVRGDEVPRRLLMQWRTGWARPGRLFDLGLAALGLWALSQLAPLVPSLDIGNLRQGLAPLWHTLQDPARFNFLQWAVYSLSIAGLAVLATTLLVPGRPVMVAFFGFVGAVLLLKIPVVGRQLSAEALAGALTASVLALPLIGLRERSAAGASALLIVAAFACAQLVSVPHGSVHPFNWVPFHGQLENPLIGIASILETLWPAAALAYLARLMANPARRSAIAWYGGLALALLVFALEWYQQFLPGRYGDVTAVLLIAATWIIFWRVPAEEMRARAQRWPAAWAVAGIAGFAAATGAGALMLSHHPLEKRVDEKRLPQLAAPDELPPIALPGFGAAHPRLPSPSASDIATLKASNPQFLREVEKRAAGGLGELESAVLQELVDPGSVDLALLHRRLMSLEFSWRGHEQAKPLAVAYDWLYARWSDAQRAELRGKLADACAYLVSVIRRERHSPYNVILYNSPFQALMACSIALYRDDPRGEPIMRFTHDLWKNRVLPVWRQVMGRDGGWHEGGEYVGIGIGQAIYQVPAMWRRATGEDLIAAEPGIRSFLDFVVYRTRPDGTHFRWGDGAWFNRLIPDAVPLALELRHAAAYSLRPPPAAPVPTAWPWGPLSDPTLYDPIASSRLPLARHFGGIGMIVARSDWSTDATYVAFKAGDNYWSHTHLDQGAFTIYKGGPLAIDSGSYGSGYGSDHHMNYTYQTVAHNTITVTDPADTLPAPGEEKDRPIANDGGQRRVGSGWGVEAAPLDRAEWEAKSDIYRTGSLGRLLDEDRLVVAVADITAAYTNRHSGRGTFSHRTRRVERFWRTFGYDALDDVIVVFDQVVATKAAFRKRWLLHTINAPHVSAEGFATSVARHDHPGRAGGRLEARVLLPKGAIIHTIGGPGFEFFVDDRNYDEGGKLTESLKKLGPANAEPGAWRVEVMPARDAAQDLFLVVLLPSRWGEIPAHRIRLLEEGSRVGCEIAGPSRTTRWWFEPGRAGVEVMTSTGDDARRYTVAMKGGH